MPPVARFMLVGFAGLAAAACAAAGTNPTTQVAQDLRPAVTRLAVLPVQNLTGRPAPLADLRAGIEAALGAHQVTLIGDDRLEIALAELRIRWMGGLSDTDAKGIRELAGADAVLVTTLDAYDAEDPPRVGLQARLVSLRSDEARPLWAASAQLAGDQTPGLLDLKLVHDVNVLIKRAVGQVAAEMAAFIRGGGGRPAGTPKGERRFRPRSLFVAADAPAFGTAIRRVAVLPLRNGSPRDYVDEIVTQQIVNELIRMGTVDVVEPGRVRKVLLDTRLIQEGGVSMPQSVVVRELLDADMVIAGTVSEYQDGGGGGPALVEFTSYGIDTRNRQVVWLARSHADGRKGVFWFGLGEIRTAGALADQLIRAVLQDVSAQSHRTSSPTSPHPGPSGP